MLLGEYMIRVITKNKEEVKVNSYYKYQTLGCGRDGKETYEALYHLYLDKNDALKFHLNDKVEVAFMGQDWKVKSVSHLNWDLCCVELIKTKTSEKEDEEVSQKSDCKLDNDCDCSCCNCDDPIKNTVNDLLNQDYSENLPKNCILVFSDGKKDTIALETKDGCLESMSVSSCHPDDTFDFHTGAKIAFNRLVKDTDCTCEEKDGEAVWINKDDDTPLLSSTGKVLYLGDFVIGHKGSSYTAGVIVKFEGRHYLCSESGPAIELNKFTDFDLVWRK